VRLLVLILCFITARPGLAAGPAELLADINTTPGTSSSSGASGPLVPLGNKLLFQGGEPSSGQELWVSDGSPLGARLLLDMTPGPESSGLRWLGTVRQTAVFVRSLEFQETELWRSGGTADGTVLVKEIEDDVWALLPLGNRVVFSTQGALWASDGTSAGTVVLHLAGAGKAVPLGGGDTGYFWFFEAANVEVVLKVLDGRPLNGKFWVFYGALSDVEYAVTVTDTTTSAVKTYTNPSGRLASVADTNAF
jgi:ELWxxDGT repeat protein